LRCYLFYVRTFTLLPCRLSRSASSSQQQQQQQQRLTSAGSTGSGGLISVGGGSGLISQSSSGLWNLQQQQQQQQQGGFTSSSFADGNQRRPSSGCSTPCRWQEQNKVGGGSLYGVADTANGALASASPGGAKREAVAGVDLVYLRNVVLRFLEAVMAGKTAERDTLLPAVAAVLQATPAEFAAMRKVLAATAPPATQVLSALGRLAQLTG
jgi:hypothetical protein